MLLLRVLLPTVIILFGLIALGMPIYVGILGATVYLQVFVNHMGLTSMFSGMFEGMAKNSLMAVPYFVLAGTFIANSSMGERLMGVFDVFLKRVRGGLAVACVCANAVFGAICGSPPAATATFGKITYDPMSKKYGESTALGVVTSSGALSSIIPPSMILIVFGIATDTSVGHLFSAGILPGLLIVLLLTIYLVFRCKPTGEKAEHIKGERRHAVVRSIPVLVLPIVILGGIYGGFFTPTEAGAVCAVYSILMSVVILKDIPVKQVPNIFRSAAKTIAQIFMLMGCSTVFGQALTVSRVPQMLTEAFSSFGTVKFLMMLNVLLLIMGCFFDAGAAVLILAPLLLPASNALGIDPVHLGIVFTVNLSIGMFTPPFGMNIFVAQSVLGKPMSKISKSLVPFIIVYIIALMIITYIPSISLALV